ncbi:DNA primase [Candidatus Woesearchaeota archaeon]|nr:DNA primase [Candidatus Woesearchaeota archaeon]
MGKISPVAAKYIIQSSIVIDGVVDRPDVIGAVFGQTEGLLGSELELRELQRSGRIGRIEVNVNTSSGKTQGEIIIPSSLDKTETALVAAALEIIQRIGPCVAKVETKKLEDVRVSKRQFVVDRAKALLKEMTDGTMPDSQELADEVSQSVRMMEVATYGRDRLAAGPSIDESEEIIVVEGRADVLNLLKYGFKNAIALNGTSVPQTIKDLSRKKSVTIFVDGDRGGDLIIREMISTAEVDFVCKAPSGMEVEEITKKEIHKALRGRITAEQAKLDLNIDENGALKEPMQNVRQHHPVANGGREFNTNNVNGNNKEFRPAASSQVRREQPLREERKFAPRPAAPVNRPLAPSSLPSQTGGMLSAAEKKLFKETLEDLFGTRGACIFDQNLNVLGKVPMSELVTTIKSLNGGVYALALDGSVDTDLVQTAENLGVTHVIATESKVKDTGKVRVSTDAQLN